jgi:predicted permease
MLPERVRRLFRLAAREPSVAEEVDLELRFHLEMTERTLVAQGMAPEQAREEALRRLGDAAATRRTLEAIDLRQRRSRHRLELLADLSDDVRFAARGIRRAPGFALAVILTLGLALGANATMFGIVDRLLLQPPPHIEQPDRIARVLVSRLFGEALGSPSRSMSYVAFTDLRDHGASFAAVAAVSYREMSLGVGLDAQPVMVNLSSGGYWHLLGTTAVLGRAFGPEEDRVPAGEPVAVLSHEFWQRHFGGRPDVLGQALVLDKYPFTVIGVAPAGFTGIDITPVDLWIPFSAGMIARSGGDWENQRTSRGNQFLYTVARLRDGVGLEAAEAEAGVTYRAGHEDWGRYEREATITLAPVVLARGPNAPIEARIAAWLLGVTVVVLLIACANVANLLLARGVQRRGEIAVRLTLGVSRPRLFRQLMVETLMLTTLGALLGLVLVIWGGGLIRATLLPGIAWTTTPVNGRVVVVTLGCTLLATILAGLVPMLRAGRMDLASALRGGTRASHATGRLRPMLLLVQTSLTTLLLVGAGLFVRSLAQVEGLDLGLEPDRALVANLPPALFGEDPALAEPRQRAFLEQLRQRHPDIEAAGFSVGGPFLGNWATSVRVPGRDSLPRLPGGGPYYFAVTEGVIEALGARILQGRHFTEGDGAATPPVVIVSELMARTLWPGEVAIGRCIHVGSGEPPCSEVVGVVADIHRQGIQENPFMMYFIPLAQAPGDLVPSNLFVRTTGAPLEMAETIRREVLALDPAQSFVRVQPYGDLISPGMRPWRLGATMFSLFGLLALLTASVGLYGVLAFLVSQQSRELGIRMALGAQPRRILVSVLRGGLGMAGAGVLVGLVAAVLLAPWLGPLLFETSPTSPGVLVAAAVTVLVIAAGASLLPARRAVRINPVEVMRSE